MRRRKAFRSHGRIISYLNHPCHLELIVTEKQEDVIKGVGKKAVKLTKKQAARQRLVIGSVNQKELSIIYLLYRSIICKKGILFFFLCLLYKFLIPLKYILIFVAIETSLQQFKS